MKSSSLLVKLNDKTPSNPVQQNTSDKIRNQFVFYSTLLKQYAEYMQRYENKSKDEVKAQIDPIVNQLVERYSFGSLFVKSISDHVNKCFQHLSSDIYTEFKDKTNLPDDVFKFCMNDFTDGNIIDMVSPKFRSIFR